jgi:hypothetical protein
MSQRNEDAEILKSFEDAFRDRVSSCRAQCRCGRSFYNPAEGEWDWEDGEIEALIAAKATPVEWAVGYITFEGVTYVLDCECWKERAKKVAAFLSWHDEQIAAFLSNEKKRKIAEANRAPTIEVQS